MAPSPDHPSESTSAPSPSASTPPPAPQTPSGPATDLKINGSDDAIRIRHNDPATTGFDPSTARWVNFFKALAGGMTKEGQFHYVQWSHRLHERRDVERCERNRDWLFRYSPVVRYMREQIRLLGGELDADNVICRRCPMRLTEDGRVLGQSGGFNPETGILICSNMARDRKVLEDTLAHEMVHAYDHLRWKVDFVGRTDLKQAACTEIRASMLSGECRWTREFFTRGNWKLTQGFQDCVRRRAINSVRARARVKDTEHATQLVNQVWDSCFVDTRPFDEIY